MLDNILKLEGATVLSKDHQKAIRGGSGCAYMLPAHAGSNGHAIVFHGTSAASAEQSVQGISGAHWCCDSCGSASWHNSSDYLHFEIAID